MTGFSAAAPLGESGTSLLRAALPDGTAAELPAARFPLAGSEAFGRLAAVVPALRAAALNSLLWPLPSAVVELPAALLDALARATGDATEDADDMAVADVAERSAGAASSCMRWASMG